MRVCVHSDNRCCLSKMRSSTKNSEKIWTYSSSRSFKVIDLGDNQKRICDFLLPHHSNRGHILHRFWDTTTYWLKIAYFSYPSLIRRPRSLCSLWNFAVKLTMRKLVTGLLCGESCMILTSTVFDWSTSVTDGQTEGQTDRLQAIAYSALCIYAVAWLQMLANWHKQPEESYLTSSVVIRQVEVEDAVYNKHFSY